MHLERLNKILNPDNIDPFQEEIEINYYIIPGSKPADITPGVTLSSLEITVLAIRRKDGTHRLAKFNSYEVQRVHH